jgi:alpha/beta hydrolase family protein
MRINGNVTSLLITLGIVSLLLIPSSVKLVATTVLDKAAVIAYGQVNKMNPNLTNLIMPENIPVKRVHVDDIDIAYKMFGKGNPILLIPGFAMRMDDWEPNVLDKLASNHTVIIFDNRGIGKTTAGNKTWSIEQFANDTAGFLDSLKIENLLTYLVSH